MLVQALHTGLEAFVESRSRREANGCDASARGSVADALCYATGPSSRRLFRYETHQMTLRVAHVNVAKNYRGGERQTELLMRELAHRGVRQVLVARRGAPLASRVADLAVQVRAVSGNPLTVALATGGVDVVHVHEGRSVYGAYARSLLSGTPYVLTRRVQNAVSDHWLAHKVYRRAAHVVAITPQLAGILFDYDPAIEAKVIYSSGSDLPVDPDASAAIRENLPGTFLVGHVGALDVQKGQQSIIDVAREFRVSAPDVHFMLVGGGKEESRLRAAAAGLGNVTFVGFVDNVGDYLAAFDVFVLPSRREGMGSILLDAMQRGLPVVASRVGGVPAIVSDGENGLLIEPERPDQLKAAILRLRAAPDLRRRLGECGREVSKRFTPGAMADRYLDLYRTAGACAAVER